MKSLSVLFGLVLLVSACSPAVAISTATEAPCAHPAAWSLTFGVSGGFVGKRESMTLSYTGELIATDERSGESVQTQASPAQLAAVAELLPALCAVPQTQTKGTPSGCNDCFEYNIAAEIDGAQYLFHGDDMTLQDSQLKPLIATLATLLTSALEESS